MQPKQCESDFANMMGRMNIWCHKFRDVSFCPHCHKPLFMTNHAEAHDKEKEQSIVDYLIFLGPTATWVECKQAEGSFAFKDLNPRQRGFMNSWMDRGLVTWLFLLMADLPVVGHRQEKQAYLIPWKSWLGVEERVHDKSQDSIPFQINNKQLSLEINAQDILLPVFALDWIPNQGWLPPLNHPVHKVYPFAKNLQPLFEKEK